MSFAISDEQEAIKRLAEKFAMAEIAPFAREWDQKETFPIPVFKKAAELGLAGIYCDPKYGGTGLGRMEAALIFEALASACPSTSAYLSIHNMVSWMVDQFGDDTLKDRYLYKLTAMDYLASYCLTEPSSGSDAASLKLTARKEGKNYILNGQKAFISGAGVTDLYCVMARTGEAGPNGISCFLVEKGWDGLTFGKPEDKMGWRNQPTCAVFFENVSVPVENRIGAEGEGFKFAMRGLDGGRINIASCSLGGAKACLQKAKLYLKTREQFGKKLSEFQALQFQLADMVMDYELARLMVWRAAFALDNQDPQASSLAAMAKCKATDMGFDIVNRALQLHGGYGYLKDYDIERYLRDLRVHQILEGTNEIMRMIVARNTFLSE